MANNCSVTINNVLDEKNTFHWKDFHTLTFLSDSTFTLEIRDSELFFAEKMLRLIPKKRVVALGKWQGREVVAKIFFDTHHAKRHFERDLSGIKKLQTNKVPTPNLLYQGKDVDQHIYILIFEYIADGENLEDICKQMDIEANMYLLQQVVMEIATQHVLGIYQHDLHLKNFLITDKTVYSLDGALIELLAYRLPKQLSIEHLALFLSQLGIGHDRLQIKLFHYYAKLRGWILKKDDDLELLLAIKQHNHARALKFEKKIFRNSTQFAKIKNTWVFAMYDRAYACPSLMTFFNNPEAFFNSSAHLVLKAGRSATVILVTMGNKKMVIKRYNIKNVWHRLRRLFRSTRAATSWYLAQKLQLFGLGTAKPVAFLEKRFFGMRSTSYYLTEYISGGHVGDYLKKSMPDENVSRVITRIIHLLKNLAKLNITHGDLKITNILLNNKDEPVLIDLDGAVEHASLSGLNPAWNKEIKRFLQNFQDQPAILEKCESLLRSTAIRKIHARDPSN